MRIFLTSSVLFVSFQGYKSYLFQLDDFLIRQASSSIIPSLNRTPMPLHDIQATVHFGHETGATVPSGFARPAPPTTQILFDLIVFDDQGKVSLACAFSAVYCTTRPNSLRLIWESAAVCRERFSTLHNFSSIHRSSPDSTQIRKIMKR